MLNVFNEVMKQKTIDQYKVIEEKYLILKRYLILYLEDNTIMSKKDLEIILKALDNEPLEPITKVYDPIETEDAIKEDEEISEENSN